MKHDANFYRERIAQAETDIAAAGLDNVRVRATRARDRWVQLAEQHEKALVERAKVLGDKAVRDAARAA